LANIETEFKNRNDFKSYLISFLNFNPLISYGTFKKKAVKYYLKNEFNFSIKKSTLANIYYTCRSNEKIFNWTTIFDNALTKDKNYFLRDERTTLIYDEESKNNYWHRHIIWVSALFIKLLQESQHIYIDATYISTKDFYQTLIIMAYSQVINKKIPCAYILMNNKLKKSYDLVFTSIFNIISLDNNKSIKLVTITTDFEKALIASVKKVFTNIRHVGCLFHYIKILRLNLSKIGLFRNNIKDVTIKFLTKLGAIPFRFNDNPNIIGEIFDEYNTLYIEDIDKNLFLKFKDYFL